MKLLCRVRSEEAEVCRPPSASHTESCANFFMHSHCSSNISAPFSKDDEPVSAAN